MSAFDPEQTLHGLNVRAPEQDLLDAGAMTADDAEAAFRQISALIDTMPDLTEREGDIVEARVPPDTLKWLGRLYTVVERISGSSDAISLKVAADNLNTSLGDRNAEAIRTIAYRTLAIAKLERPLLSVDHLSRLGMSSTPSVKLERFLRPLNPTFCLLMRIWVPQPLLTSSC